MGTVLVDSLNAGSGNIEVISQTGSILDGSDVRVDLAGDGVRLNAAGDIGSLSNALEVSIGILTLRSGGNVRLEEANDIAIGEVTVTLIQVEADGSGTTLTGTAQSDLVLSGALVLVAGGTVTVTDGANGDGVGISITGTGNLLLKATGLNLQAGVNLSNGSVSLLADNTVNFTSSAQVNATAGTVDVMAIHGSVLMEQGAVIRTVAKNIRVRAGLNIVLGLLDARTAGDRLAQTRSSQNSWGTVSVTADQGSVTDALLEDTTTNIYGRAARLTAALSIGTTGSIANAIETDVMTLSARSSRAGLNLFNATTLTVGTIDTVPANRVQENGTLILVADGAIQSGLVKAAGALLNVNTANNSNVLNLPVLQILNVLTKKSVPNHYTGLYEQVVRISNPTGSTIDSVRIYIRALPAGVAVINAAGRENNVPYIQVQPASRGGPAGRSDPGILHPQ